MTPDDKLFQLLVDRLHGLEKRAERAEHDLRRIRDEIQAVERQLSGRIGDVEKQAIVFDQQSGFMGSKIAMIVSLLGAAAALVVAIFRDKIWP